MDSPPPWLLSANSFANCRGSLWSHLGASKLTSSLGAGSRYRSRRRVRGCTNRRPRIRVDVASARNNDGRNRMFENQLLLITGFENDRVLVKRSNTARQLDSTDQIDRNVMPFLSCCVEKGILNILLCRLGFHLPISFFG